LTPGQWGAIKDNPDTAIGVVAALMATKDAEITELGTQLETANADDIFINNACGQLSPSTL
jgi:hypothetical protein